jgi:hypothetical protein
MTGWGSFFAERCCHLSRDPKLDLLRVRRTMHVECFGQRVGSWEPSVSLRSRMSNSRESGNGRTASDFVREAMAH